MVVAKVPSKTHVEEFDRVIPLLTREAMRHCDARAVSQRGVDSLVRDAGTAVALEARRLLGRCYGARVAVMAGAGLNGADGRVAATWLRSRGAVVQIYELDQLPAIFEGFDLVIDAALGLGASRAFYAPHVAAGTKVLAVDLPSGLDPDTGAALGEPLAATATLALGALKLAHVNGPAAHVVGELRFSSLGIESDARDGLVDDGDLSGFVRLNANDHKWKHAVAALVGSTSMPGAAELVLRGALVGGASMVRLSSIGNVAAYVHLAPEVVHAPEGALDARCRAVVAGPGLGDGAPAWLREELRGLSAPLVLDADGLDRSLIDDLAPRDGSWVLTPHEGEFTRLTGRPVGPDRLAAVRAFAKATGCVVLLKGPTTFVARPNGDVRVVTSGSAALATAGSGDVLAGLIAASIARGHEPFDAAAKAAHLHGLAGRRLRPYGVASDIAKSIGFVVADLARSSEVPTF